MQGLTHELLHLEIIFGNTGFKIYMFLSSYLVISILRVAKYQFTDSPSNLSTFESIPFFFSLMVNEPRCDGGGAVGNGADLALKTIACGAYSMLNVQG